MALFKISQGQASSLSSQPLTEGYCWFTPEDGKFYIDAKINNVLQRIPLNGNGRLFYGTSSTAAATVDKEVLCPEYNTLLPGDIVVVKFSTTNSGAVASLTLNVNGTGKKSIKKQYNNSLANLTNAGELRADTISIFVYNGTYWMLANGDWNGNDTGYYILTNGFRGQVGSNQIFKYTLFGRTSDGTYESFVTSSSTGTSKAKNAHGFLPEGKIYYNANNSNYAAGLLNFSPYEQYHTIDYRYTFNISTTGIPASANTYLKFTYSDGLLYLADTWFATALPTTEDGFIYQRIGSNYYNSADYRGSLLLNNPYYIYKNNKIQVWHGGVSTRALTADTASAANTASTADTWTTGRTLTIGGAGKTVDGSSNVSWSLSEIGASVENTLTAGNSSTAPKISTTVNGVTGNEITLTTATTDKYGVTKLTDAVTSNNSSLAVTGKAVSAAITNSINALDVTSVGGNTGNYISTISQSDGKISATADTFDPSLNITDGTSGVAPKIAIALNGITGNEITLTKATTGIYGVTKLTDTVTSSDSSLATTGKAVSTAITNAINNLDVAEVGASGNNSSDSNGKYIAKIKEVDGKISATVFTTSVSNTITDGATANDAPTISTTVNGVTGGSQPITIATTGKYGVTKLTDTISASDSSLAVTGKAVNSAISTAVSTAINALDFTEIGGSTGDYINKISQANGVITATKSTFDPVLVFTAGTSSAAPKIAPKLNNVTGGEITLTIAATDKYGVTKLTDTVTSTNSSLAVTGKAVNTAITNAINALDVAEVGASSTVTTSDNSNGEYIAKIKEVDGKISATVFTTSVSNIITAGTASDAPKIATKVNGVTGGAQELTKATTGVYGATKLLDAPTNPTQVTDFSDSDKTQAITAKYLKSRLDFAINSLDATAVGGSTGNYVSGISQSNGIISASVGTFDPSLVFTAGTGSAAPKIAPKLNGVTGGEITLTTASTSVYGVTKLTSSYNATSPDSTLAINGAGVKAAIETLDVNEVGAGSAVTSSENSNGEYIAKIKEVDGKITATVFTTSVGNTLTDGTSSAAPKITTTVNGVTGSEIILTTADTNKYGVTKLTSSYNATSPDTTLAINGAGVQAAIQTLDVTEVGASSTTSDTSDGKYIAKIKEEDGKISATVFTTSVSNILTDGTSSAAPKIKTKVNGVVGGEITLTTASTSVYGVTKLTDTYSSTNSTLAVTGAAIASAVGAYLPLAGGTMTGILTLKGNQYADSYSGALNANNSNIYGLNSIYTADASDNAAEGIHFYRSATNVDTLWISGGNIYFVPNRALGTSTTAANSQKVLRGPATITDGYLFAADSTSGLTKQIQATNANTASTIVQRDANGNFSAGTITATSFNGNVPEANLVWGGKNFSASYGCIDAAMIEPLGANRFAFLKAAGLTIEYSTDGGSNWTDYGATDVQKTGLFGAGQSFVLGKHTTAGTNTVNDQLRVTIATGAAGLYTVLNKIAIYMSTSGNTVQVKMEKALESTPTTFSTHLDWTGISGWSGWNILNISNITTYGNSAASQYGRIRFTFRQTAVNTNYSSASISRIMGFGGMGWTVPSNMARDGHLYSYDNAQNATFPATVTAPTFDGFATKIRVNPSTTPTAVGSIWVTT